MQLKLQFNYAVNKWCLNRDIDTHPHIQAVNANQSKNWELDKCKSSATSCPDG